MLPSWSVWPCPFIRAAGRDLTVCLLLWNSKCACGARLRGRRRNGAAAGMYRPGLAAPQAKLPGGTPGGHVRIPARWHASAHHCAPRAQDACKQDVAICAMRPEVAIALELALKQHRVLCVQHCAPQNTYLQIQTISPGLLSADLRESLRASLLLESRCSRPVSARHISPHPPYVLHYSGGGVTSKSG